MTFVTSCIGHLAELNSVLTISGSENADEWILHAEPGIVGVSQDGAVRIENSQARVQGTTAKAHPFDFDRETLSFLYFDRKEIDIFVIDHAIDYGVEIDFLGVGWIVIGFFFGEFR